VTVDNGEVTLSGAVSDRSDKRRAEDLIEQVSGVRDVHNHLRVSRQEEAGGVGRSGVDIPNPGITGGGPSGASNMNPTRR
jgi:hypothetical protein